jgi:cell fate regulator YaaT (PSP1 superfamily)
MNKPADISPMNDSEELPPKTEQGEEVAVMTSKGDDNSSAAKKSVESAKSIAEERPVQKESGEKNAELEPSSDTKNKKNNSVTSGKKIIGILLQDSHMVYRVAANFPELEAKDSLLLQTRNGEVVGRVVYISSDPPVKSIDPSLLFPGGITRIVRKLCEKDLQAIEKKTEIEKNAKIVCRKTIRELKLAMKLASVTYQQKGAKILFHFTSEGRIDFRELVRQLGTKLKNRIEMRHIGVRDETRLLSGIGPCGKELCCSQYLKKFHPVSVRMAKNQDLSLNPDGISGVCGRLLCCLAYENDTYAELKKGLPKVKKCCWTESGQEATVKCIHTLSSKVTVQHKDGSYETLPAATLSKEKPPPREHDNLGAPLEKEVLNYQKKPDSRMKKQSETDSSGTKVEADKKAASSTKPETDASSKSERKRKSRRRRRKKSKGDGSENQSANSQAQQQETSATNSGNKSATPTTAQTKPGGDAKDGASDEQPRSKGKRRRRRRRKSGNRNKEGSNTPASGSGTPTASST